MARTTDNNFVDYPLKKVPGELWDRVKQKAEAHRPPLTIRWVIISLLEKFAPPEDGLKPMAKARKPRKKLITPVPPPAAELPDLGESF